MVCTYRELLAACDRIGLRVGLELRGAAQYAKTTDTLPCPYRQVLSVRRPHDRLLLGQASGEGGEHLDALAGRCAGELELVGVPLRAT